MSWSNWAQSTGEKLADLPPRLDLQLRLASAFVLIDGAPSFDRQSGETTGSIDAIAADVLRSGADGFVLGLADGRVHLLPLSALERWTVDAIVEVQAPTLEHLVFGGPEPFDVQVAAGEGRLAIAGNGYLAYQIALGAWRSTPGGLAALEVIDGSDRPDA